jgi:uncharacterized protein YegL
MRKLLSSLAVCLAAAGLEGNAAAQDSIDNVVVVLDASGSMGGKMKGSTITKMEAAKSALKEVLRQIPETTHVGLLVFSAKDLKDPWVYPLGPRDDARLNPAIDRLRPNAGTPLGQFIKIGADRLLQERQKQFGYGTYRLLVVTDGEANDQDLVDLYTPEVISRGIILDAIGVDMNQRHTLATRAHSYRSANDPESLKRAIQEVFAELGGGTKSNTTEEEAFALIAPLPLEAARAAIQALAVSGNDPIGVHPVARVNSSGAHPPATAVNQPLKSARKRVPFIVTVAFFFVVVLLLRAISRAARR